MASVSWTLGSSGSWNTAADWSTGAVPLQGDDVTINASSSATITYSTGALLLDSLTVGGGTLAVTGGMLAAEGGYELTSGLNVSAGALRLVNGNFGDVLSGSVVATGGTITLSGGAQGLSGNLLQATGNTINIQGGAFNDQFGTTVLGGAVGGVGVLDFNVNNGQVYFDTGLALSVATTEINAGTVNLNLAGGKITDAKSFLVNESGTLSLNNETLTLSGKGALYGTLTNGGVVTLSGTGILNNTIVDNGAEINVTGVTKQTGNIDLGASGGGSLLIAQTGSLRLVGNVQIDNGSNGTLTNGGVLSLTGADLSGALIQTTVINTGTIRVDQGTLAFAGPNQSSTVSSIGGTLAGAGIVQFAQGYYNLALTSLTASHTVFANSVNVTLSTALTYAGDWVQNGGLLLFQDNLTLSGRAAFDGGEVKGTATIGFSAGSSLLLGAGMDLEGNLIFDLNGAVTQSGSITLGYLSDSVDQATLTAGNSWVLEGGAGIAGAYGTITNTGLFEKLSGAQNSIVASDFINVAGNGNAGSGGTLLVNTGTLSLTGHGTLDGTVTGSAVLDIGGAFELGTSLTLSVGEFIMDTNGSGTLNGNLSYGGNWASEGGTLALNPTGSGVTGDTLTLTGTASLLSGGFSQTGAVIVSGPAVIGQLGAVFTLAQGADLTLSGHSEQAGSLLMTSGATAPTLTIAAGGSYIIDNGVDIGGSLGNSPSGTLVVSGKITASGTGTVTLDTTIVDNNSISVSYGTMEFLGQLSGHGSIGISSGGTAILESMIKATNTVSFGLGGGVLDLGVPAAFAGTISGFATGDAIELQGFAFSTSVTPTISGNDVTLVDSSGNSATLIFSTAQTLSQLEVTVGPHGGLTLYHT